VKKIFRPELRHLWGHDAFFGIRGVAELAAGLQMLSFLAFILRNSGAKLVRNLSKTENSGKGHGRMFRGTSKFSVFSLRPHVMKRRLISERAFA
jgi:hypothetical protein